MKMTSLLLSVLMASTSMAQVNGDSASVKSFITAKKQEINADMMKIYTLKQALASAEQQIKVAEIDRRDVGNASAFVIIPGAVTSFLSTTWMAASWSDGYKAHPLAIKGLKIGGVAIVGSFAVVSASAISLKISQNEVETLKLQINTIESGLRQRNADLEKIEEGLKNLN